MGRQRRERTVEAAVLGHGVVHSVYGREAPIVRERCCSRAALRSLLWTAVLTALLGGAGQHGDRVVDLVAMNRAARAERLVDDTVAALAAYPFATVAGLHGCSMHERERVDGSEFKVDLAVTETSTGSLKIEGVLRDTKSQRAMSSFVTYRDRT
ncbi:MAG: hypothetical protein R3F56_05295 [Planctomycetota bacterium]